MRGSDYEVIIPQVTIGEAFTEVLTRGTEYLPEYTSVSKSHT